MAPTVPRKKEGGPNASSYSNLASCLDKPSIGVDDIKSTLRSTITSPRSSHFKNKVFKPAPLRLNSSKVIEKPKFTSSLVTGRTPTPLTSTLDPLQIEICGVPDYPNVSYIPNHLSGIALSKAIGQYRNASPQSSGLEIPDQWGTLGSLGHLSTTVDFGKLSLGSDIHEKVKTENNKEKVDTGSDETHMSDSDVGYWLDNSDIDDDSE